jgi:hypothetical protein
MAASFVRVTRRCFPWSAASVELTGFRIRPSVTDHDEHPSA